MKSTFVEFGVMRGSFESGCKKFTAVIMVIVVVGILDDHHLVGVITSSGSST